MTTAPDHIRASFNLSEPVPYGDVRDLRAMIDDTRERADRGDFRPGTARVSCVGQVTCVRLPGKRGDSTYLPVPGSIVLRYVDAHASVTIGDDRSLSVMCVDAYARQRELSVKRVARSHPDYASGAWQVHAYAHRIGRAHGDVSRSVAIRFTDRFRELCVSYPIMLWQVARHVRPDAPDTVPTVPAAGYVHAHDRMTFTGELSVTALP